MSPSFLAFMINLGKHALVGFLALWPACSFASGWNDFQRDIGHGFLLWKADSFDVCIQQRGQPDQGFTSAQVCGSKHKGDYGPVSGYFFTDEHLLVRTHGAKPSEIPGLFTTDTSREHFFIIPKQVPEPFEYSVTPPLVRDEFYRNPAVPADIQWERPTRFESSPRDEGDRSLIIDIVLTIIAWLVVFGPIVIWPIIFFWVVWWMFERIRKGDRSNR